MQIVIDISEEEYSRIKENDMGFYNGRFFQMIRNGTPLPSKWIPISKETPKKCGWYLTTTIYNETYCDYWDGDRFNRSEVIIAWMELPPSYKAESEVE